MIEALRTCLASWQAPDAAGEYASRMWRHTLDYHALPAADRRDGSGALPYLPVDPDALGCRLTTADSVLDVGCLGGYGLFDFAQSRRYAGVPVPRLIGVDQAASSIELACLMAAHWDQAVAEQPQDSAATLTPSPSPKGRGELEQPRKNVDIDRKDCHDATTVFLHADAVHLPLPDKTCRVVIARLLLPYTSINDALRELTRVLAEEGLLYLQVHGPRYYLRSLSRRYRKPRIAAYYLRPLMACAWLRLTGHQPSAPWFRETALTDGMLQRLMEPFGFTEQWRDSDEARPFAVYRRSANADFACKSDLVISRAPSDFSSKKERTTTTVDDL